MRRISIKGAAAVTVAVMALAGCQSGGSEPAKPADPAASPAPASNGIAALPADEILQRARTALTAAKSYRLKGTMVTDGQNSTMDFAVDGADLNGTMAFGDVQVELLAVGPDKYMRGNQQFWAMGLGPEQGPRVGAVIADRWIAGADSDASFAQLFTIGTVEEVVKATGTVSKAEEKEIGGVPAIGLRDSGDPEGLLWVATTGEPYPLRLTNTAQNAELVFSGIGEPVTGLTKPADGQVLDLEQLQKK